MSSYARMNKVGNEYSIDLILVIQFSSISKPPIPNPLKLSTQLLSAIVGYQQPLFAQLGRMR
jgi:hypothetical protein